MKSKSLLFLLISLVLSLFVHPPSAQAQNIDKSPVFSQILTDLIEAQQEVYSLNADFDFDIGLESPATLQFNSQGASKIDIQDSIDLAFDLVAHFKNNDVDESYNLAYYIIDNTSYGGTKLADEPDYTWSIETLSPDQLKSLQTAYTSFIQEIGLLIQEDPALVLANVLSHSMTIDNTDNSYTLVFDPFRNRDHLTQAIKDTEAKFPTLGTLTSDQIDQIWAEMKDITYQFVLVIDQETDLLDSLNINITFDEETTADFVDFVDPSNTQTHYGNLYVNANLNLTNYNQVGTIDLPDYVTEELTHKDEGLLSVYETLIERYDSENYQANPITVDDVEELLGQPDDSGSGFSSYNYGDYRRVHLNFIFSEKKGVLQHMAIHQYLANETKPPNPEIDYYQLFGDDLNYILSAEDPKKVPFQDTQISDLDALTSYTEDLESVTYSYQNTGADHFATLEVTTNRQNDTITSLNTSQLTDQVTSFNLDDYISPIETLQTDNTASVNKYIELLGQPYMISVDLQASHILYTWINSREDDIQYDQFYIYTDLDGKVQDTNLKEPYDADN